MRNHIPNCLALAIAIPLALGSPQDNVVSLFIQKSLAEDYPKWITDHNLDPSPIHPLLRINVGYSNESDSVHGLLTNLSVRGLSGGILAFPPPTVNLSNSYIEIGYGIPGFQFGGQYFLNGSIRSNNIAVEGQGAWNLTLHVFYIFGHRIAYKDFETTEEGYINLTNAQRLTSLWPEPEAGDYVYGSSMEGLAAGGFEREMARTVTGNFLRTEPELFCGRHNPIVRYVDEFLSRALLSTPISEMGVRAKDELNIKLNRNGSGPLKMNGEFKCF